MPKVLLAAPHPRIDSADNASIGGSRSENAFVLGNCVSSPDPDLAPVAPTFALKAGTSFDTRSPAVTYTVRGLEIC